MAHPREGWQGQSAAKMGKHNLGGNIRDTGGYHKGYDDGGLVFKGGTDQGEPKFDRVAPEPTEQEKGMAGAVQAGEESAMPSRDAGMAGAVQAGEEAAAMPKVSAKDYPDRGEDVGPSSATITPAKAAKVAGEAAGSAAAMKNIAKKAGNAVTVGTSQFGSKPLKAAPPEKKAADDTYSGPVRPTTAQRASKTVSDWGKAIGDIFSSPTKGLEAKYANKTAAEKAEGESYSGPVRDSGSGVTSPLAGLEKKYANKKAAEEKESMADGGRVRRADAKRGQ